MMEGGEIQTVTPQDAGAVWTKARVLVEIKQNYPLALVSLLPGVESREHRLPSAAKRLGVDGPRFQEFRHILLESGVWLRRGKEIYTNFELLDVGDLTVQDHLSMTVDIISRLSQDRSHEYEYLSVATNRDLVRNFVGKVRKALNELYQESRNAPKECVFSWTQTGVIELEVKKEKSDEGV
jgi:hypothetical protein